MDFPRHLLWSLIWLLPICVSQAALTERETNTLKLQIFLNENNFGPGFLDAQAGRFTMLAIKNYNLKHGRAETDFRYVKEAQINVSDAVALAVTPSFAAKYVDSSLSKKREVQAAREDMPYRSYAEFMAERYHTSVNFLTKINGQKAIKALKPRSPILVPNVDPFMIEKLAHGRMYRAKGNITNRYAIIDTKSNEIKIYEKTFLISGQAPESPFKSRPVESLEDIVLWDQWKNDPPKPKMVTEKLSDEEAFKRLTYADLIASFPITPGKPQFIHRGYWAVKTSIELPIWRYDKSLLETGMRSKESLTIPGGPNNPVGVMWHGLTRKGIGIHGTSSPETIGRSQSAGCIRLSNWDVVKLPALLRPGTKVWLK